MTDYSELIKKLRDLHRDPRPASAEWLFENQVALYDAAAAIEALQAELEKKRTADCWGCKCEKLEKLELKRGEWEPYDPKNCLYTCSACRSVPRGKTRYCPNCGAKMEVQDG